MKTNRTIKVLFAVGITMIGIYFINSSEIISNGAKYGIDLCIKSVIPSLYIFTILCLFIIKCEVFNDPIFSFFTKVLLGVKRDIGIVYFLSLFCGYPIGAMLINELFGIHKISRKDAEKMLLFSTNPGPSFCISSIGAGCYNNVELGLILYLSCIFSSIICIRIYHPKENQTKNIKQSYVNYKDGFLSSIEGANKAMISICGWVVLSSSIIYILNSLNIDSPLVFAIEVTAGAVFASKKYSIFIVAFLLGFGGLSIHLQILSNANNIKPNYIKILISRIIHGILSMLTMYILLKLFPQELSVSSIKLIATNENNSIFSAFCLVAFVCTSLIFLQNRIKQR